MSQQQPRFENGRQWLTVQEQIDCLCQVRDFCDSIGMLGRELRLLLRNVAIDIIAVDYAHTANNTGSRESTTTTPQQSPNTQNGVRTSR